MAAHWMRRATTRLVPCAESGTRLPATAYAHVLQIQGMNWDNLPKNIPTYSNMPWAVGPNVRHRNDWGNAERACVMLSGEDCILDTTSSFDSCAVRCVGTGSPGFAPTDYGWTTPQDRASVGHPQVWYWACVGCRRSRTVVTVAPVRVRVCAGFACCRFRAPG